MGGRLSLFESEWPGFILGENKEFGVNDDLFVIARERRSDSMGLKLSSHIFWPQRP